MFGRPQGVHILISSFDPYSKRPKRAKRNERPPPPPRRLAFRLWRSCLLSTYFEGALRRSGFIVACDERMNGRVLEQLSKILIFMSERRDGGSRVAGDVT